MNKNPWIKKRKDKDDGWEYLEHGFKIRHTDRNTPMIFRQDQDPFGYQPHNPNWYSLKNGKRYFELRQDRSKDWKLVEDRALRKSITGAKYSVPKGGM